jgi:hypothetical protein
MVTETAVRFCARLLVFCSLQLDFQFSGLTVYSVQAINSLL